MLAEVKPYQILSSGNFEAHENWRRAALTKACATLTRNRTVEPFFQFFSSRRFTVVEFKMRQIFTGAVGYRERSRAHIRTS
jgi:hypothetical protein